MRTSEAKALTKLFEIGDELEIHIARRPHDTTVDIAEYVLQAIDHSKDRLDHYRDRVDKIAEELREGEKMQKLIHGEDVYEDADAQQTESLN